MGATIGCMGNNQFSETVTFPDDDDESVQLLSDRSDKIKTVAVTGANGFIGSRIVQLLLKKGYKVRGTVQDNKHELVDFLTVLENAAKNLTLHEKELMDDRCFDEVFQGCDCVFHVASPTFKHQREMKEPHEEMIHMARFGTSNVLNSCVRMGVKTVVLTSSMCSAIPETNVPSGGISEIHKADPHKLMKKGSHYAASKTFAEYDAHEFVRKLPKDKDLRLIRILPTFTVGPMLQPTVNSSMERFFRICAGKHHVQIPNRSISLVDVRDTAAHHVAAYEKGLPGRFLSTTEGWHWTLVYSKLKQLIPEMKCPKPLPNGIKHQRPRKYNTLRMKELGVRERSFQDVLEGAVEEYQKISSKENISNDPIQCHHISNISDKLAEFFRKRAGYYYSVKADGTFFMIETIAEYATNKPVSYMVFLSWIFPGYKDRIVMQVMANSDAHFVGEKLNVGVYKVSLTFTPLADSWRVKGTIEDNEIEAISSVLPIPPEHFATSYLTKDDSGSSFKITLGGTNNTITHNLDIITDFIYNPTKRVFEYGDETVRNKLFLNAAAGHGLRLTFVHYDIEKLPGTTELFYLNTNVTRKSGPSTGAEDLAAFAGFYPLNVNGSSFVSIVGITDGTSKESVSVGICLDGSHSKEYSSFNFDSSTNTLTFPQDEGLTLKFEKEFMRRPITKVTLYQINTKLILNHFTAINYFAPAPISAFGSYTLTGTDPKGVPYSLLIENGNNGETIVYKKNGVSVFKPTTMFKYNAVEQDAVFEEIVFNLTYNADRGISCGVTTIDQSGMPAGFQAVVYAFPY